jgi:hypothetical protein
MSYLKHTGSTFESLKAIKKNMTNCPIIILLVSMDLFHVVLYIHQIHSSNVFNMRKIYSLQRNFKRSYRVIRSLDVIGPVFLPEQASRGNPSQRGKNDKKSDILKF